MNKRLLLLTCAVGAFSSLVGVHVAAAADAPNDQSASNVAEVVVTAEKREASVQKVPVAVTAITAKERETVGIITLQDMTNFTPGMTYTSTTDHLYVRGVGRQTINLGADAGVAAYSDGFYNPDPVLIVLPSMFTGTTQILRGPQGTLFGRNGIGGAIDVSSVRPTSSPYAEVRATVGNYGVYNGEAAVSGPLAPGLNFRLAGFSVQQNQGYFSNVAGGPSESGAVKTAYIEASISAKLGENNELYVHAFTFTNNSRGGPGARAGWDANPYGTAVNSMNTQGGANLSFNPAAGYNPANIVAGSLVQSNNSITGNPAVGNKYHFSSSFATTVDNKNTGDVNVIFTHHFENVDLKYTGGYQQYLYHTNQPSETFGYTTDVTQYTLNPGPFGSLTVYPEVKTDYTQTDAWYSHEINLATTTNGPLQLIGGAYYYHESFTNPVWVSMDKRQTQVASPYGFLNGNSVGQFALPFLSALNPFVAPGLNLLGLAAPNPTNNLYSADYQMQDSSAAVYGQVDYAVNEKWKLTGGLRYSSDHKWGTEEYRLVTFGGGAEYVGLVGKFAGTPLAALAPLYVNGFMGSFTPALDLTSCPAVAPVGAGSCAINSKGQAVRNLSGSSSAFTGTAGVEWTPDRDTLGYLRYSRGYKELGFNAGGIAGSPQVAPELMNDYEAGIKHTFGRNLVVDAAVFYEDYLNMQIPLNVYNPNTGLTTSNLVNISKSRSDGFELETIWTPIQHLQALLSYSFNDTAILATGQYLDTANPILGPQSVKGNPLPNASKNKITLNGNYTFIFEPGSLNLSATYMWRDTQQGSIFKQTYWQTPAWNQVDLRATWKSTNDRYEVVAYGRNVFNSSGYPQGASAYVSGSAVTPAVYTIYTAYTANPPATYGVELHYKFF